MSKEIYFLGIHAWLYSDKRMKVWLGSKEVSYSDTKHHLSLELDIFRELALGFTVKVGCEEDRDITLAIGFVMFKIYISVNNLVVTDNEKIERIVKASRGGRWAMSRSEVDFNSSGRTTGIMLSAWKYGGSLSIQLWEDGMSWTSRPRIVKFKNFPYCEGTGWIFSVEQISFKVKKILGIKPKKGFR